MTEGAPGRLARVAALICCCSASCAPLAPPPLDHPGGWRSDTACVDICGVTPESPVARPPAVTCFAPADPVCAAKTGAGDYDYLLLSQHWLPTVCAGLESGYDTTLTHRGAARCGPLGPNLLTVHGLWPNYDRGFPQCCGEALPLDPAAIRAWPAGLRRRLAEEWPDPAAAGFDGALCEAWNHEWQKHGTCFAPADDAGVRAYFETGLLLAERLAAATEAVEARAAGRHARAEFETLYPRAARFLCDARHPARLLEIHTCWTRTLDPRDCPPASAFGPLLPCGDEITLPPGQHRSPSRGQLTGSPSIGQAQRHALAPYALNETR